MKLLKGLLVPVLALSFVGSLSAAVETYKIDSTHSSVAFTIRRFFTKVPGSFNKFTGAITVDRDNLEKSSVEATIEVASVNTAAAQRDAHLNKPEFFDSAQFSTITFKSKSWKKTGEDAYDVTGDLTMKGVTKEVVLATKVLGFGPGAKGNPQSGWEATTTLKKSDFGVSGPAALGKTLSDEVMVDINITADLAK